MSGFRMTCLPEVELPDTQLTIAQGQFAVSVGERET